MRYRGAVANFQLRDMVSTAWVVMGALAALLVAVSLSRGGGALLFSSHGTSSPQHATHATAHANAHHRHVAVVGGGLAGLSAALQLAHSGAKVTLLEQEKTLGGNSAKGKNKEKRREKTRRERKRRERELMTSLLCLLLFCCCSCM